jgi:hypothetical protein
MPLFHGKYRFEQSCPTSVQWNLGLRTYPMRPLLTPHPMFFTLCCCVSFDGIALPPELGLKHVNLVLVGRSLNRLGIGVVRESLGNRGSNGLVTSAVCSISPPPLCQES